jgi:xylulokinase
MPHLTIQMESITEKRAIMKYLMGIDIGTSSVKTILIDENGQLRADETVEYELSQPFPGWAEQDPELWWDATILTIERVLQNSGINSKQLAGVGLSGQMHGSVFLDKNMEVLRPAILWCDQRTTEECEWITKHIDKSLLTEWVGNKALTGFTAPKIMWVKKHEPEIYEKIETVLLPKDYIRYKLTGKLATEVSDASGTLLFDVGKREWSKKMLDVLDIPEDWMPPVFESHIPSACLSEELTNKFGLSHSVPVAGGGGDQAAGAVGTGVVYPGILSVSLGTSGVVFAFNEELLVDEQNRLHSFCHAVNGKWHTMGVMLSAAECLRWWAKTVGQEEQALANKSSKSPYEIMCDAAGKSPVGSKGLLFLPYLMGERTPYADANARGCYIGLTTRHTKGMMTRSILEGVAYGLRDSVEIMRDLNIPIKQIRVTGGGAKSKYWRQILADVIGVEVVTLENTEGPAFGAALLAGVAADLYSDVETVCNQLVHVKEVIQPDRENVKVYNHYYRLYRELYSTLKNTFDELSQLERNSNILR